MKEDEGEHSHVIASCQVLGGCCYGTFLQQWQRFWLMAVLSKWKFGQDLASEGSESSSCSFWKELEAPGLDAALNCIPGAQEPSLPWGWPR